MAKRTLAVWVGLACVSVVLATSIAAADKEALLKPESLNETAPDSFRVKFVTTKGDVILEVNREWAPIGADRFYNLVKHGFYDDMAFFRVIPGFMAQFGISGDPELAEIWSDANLRDDPVVQSNHRGFVTYAKKNSPNSRSTQLFINYQDNSRLDSMDFAPFAKVVEGMEVVDALHGGYGEGAPRGRGPNQGRLISEGNTYLKGDFPNLDYITEATILE
jgi:peptidyl-prolyl cis-trans isomerase A (cyclophilin A)